MSHIQKRASSWARLAIAAVSVGALALSLAACTAEPEPTAAPVDHSDPVEPLTVLTPNADPSGVVNLLLANNLGYFEDANVEITIVNGAGAAGASLLASGEADMFDSSATIGFPLAAQGMPISMVWSDVGGGLGATLSVATDSPYEELDDLAGKKVGTIGTTGGTAGFANLLSGLVVDNGGAPFEIVAFNDAATLLNALVSGQIDAASASTGTVAVLVAEKKVRQIVDTSQPDQRDEYIGSEFTTDTGFMGLRDNLDGKRESVVRFLEAMLRADDYRVSHDLDEIAEILAEDEMAAALTAEQIAQSLTARNPFYSTSRGAVSEASWEATLDWFTRWNIPAIGAVADDQLYSYDEIVDMSYYDEALSRVGE